jgi:hypothetical protein
MAVSKGAGAGLIAAVIAGVGLGATNPDEKKHREAIYSAVKKEAGAAGTAALDLMAALGQDPFRYQSYVVFSVTRVEDRTVSYGVLGSVFLGELKKPGATKNE